TTHGSPNSRAMIAPCDSMPPRSTTRPRARNSSGPQPGSVWRVTRMSPRPSLCASPTPPSTAALPSTRPPHAGVPDSVSPRVATADLEEQRAQSHVEQRLLHARTLAKRDRSAGRAEERTDRDARDRPAVELAHQRSDVFDPAARLCGELLARRRTIEPCILV